jgi:hypothetical protein
MTVLLEAFEVQITFCLDTATIFKDFPSQAMS